MKRTRTAEERHEEKAIRQQHALNPVKQQPADSINQQSFAAILSLMARFKTSRENQGLTLAEVAQRMGIDAPALSRLETGKMLNPTLGTLHKWAEALGQKLGVDLSVDSFIHTPNAPAMILSSANHSKYRKRWRYLESHFFPIKHGKSTPEF